MKSGEESKRKGGSLTNKIMGIICLLLLLKTCSYKTNHGENYGRLTQYILSIVDSIIPWP